MEEGRSPRFPHRMCKPVCSLTTDISVYLLGQISNCKCVQSLTFSCKPLQLPYANRFSLAQYLLMETSSHSVTPKPEQLGLSQQKISVSTHLM